MENLAIFKMFLSFPLAGILIPDVGLQFTGPGFIIQTSHFIVEITLIVSIIVCTIGMNYLKKQQNGGSVTDSSLVRV